MGANLHTILGAGGVIGNGLARELFACGEKVRLVSRRARPQTGAEVRAADLTDAAQTLAAVQGSRVVYLVAGLPYHYGEPIKGFIDRWFNLLVVAFTVLLVGGFAILKYAH